MFGCCTWIQNRDVDAVIGNAPGGFGRRLLWQLKGCKI